MADNKTSGDSAKGGTGTQQTTYRPMRTTLTALGVGTGWAGLHMPAIHGLTPSLLTWLIDVIIVSLIAKSALELISGVTGWCVRAVADMFHG